MRLCLVVRVHPVRIDHPQRVVVPHLVAVTKLVCLKGNHIINEPFLYWILSKALIHIGSVLS